MKKITINFVIAILVIIGLGITSCRKANNGSQIESSEIQQIDPQEEIMAFVNEFVNKLNAGERDSIAYPDILSAREFNSVNNDSTSISELGPGQYEVSLPDGIILKVNRSENGNITITDSYGLFDFPKDKVKIAKKTGMWEEGLSDSQMAMRINDEAFFQSLKNQKEVNTNNLISISDIKFPPGEDYSGTATYEGYQYLTNNTDHEIKGSDYNIIYEYEFMGEYGWPDSDKGTKTKAGKTIPPRGKVKIYASGGYHGGEMAKKIKWKLSKEQLAEKFSSYTGNEYQEYLDSKK